MLAPWPLWWALGVGDYISIVLAIPMAYQMYLWWARRNRPILLPPGFGMWVLFLIVMFGGLATLSFTAPDTLPGPVSHRLFSWLLRALTYVTATIILVWAGNLTEREMSRHRLAYLMGLVAIYAVVFGIAGVFYPSFHFTSPLAHLVPQSIQAQDSTIASELHPGLTQLQTFHGFGRPSAPFSYSNGWGDNLAILLPWLVVGWRMQPTTPRRRRIANIVLAVAFIPIIFSFDRGLWVGLLCAGLYMVARFTRRVTLGQIMAVVGTLLLVTVILVATPLDSLINSRIHTGSSNAGRSSQAVIALKGALTSPVLGYGDTRHEQGGSQSIAIGKTANCPDCGSNDIGAHGQFWLLLFADGFAGTIFYLGFFGYGVWQFRRDRTPIGIAGELVLLLGFVFMFVYLQVGITLTFTILAYTLLWRNDRYRREELAAARADEVPPVAGGNGSPAGAPA
jgi:hypothetical protein